MPLSATSGLASLRRILRSRNGRVFFGGSLLAWTGLWMQRIAVGWLAWDLSGSAFWLGVVAFADLFPAVIVSPIAGAVADRQDRIRLTITVQLIVVVQATALAAMVAAGEATIARLIALELVLGVAQSFAQPARQSLMPGLVPREDLAGAVALNSLTFNVARFTGPACAGLLIVETSIAVPIAINALCYLVATLSLPLLRVAAADRVGHAPSRSIIAEMVDGFRYVARHPGIGRIMLFAGVIGVFARPMLELMPAFADGLFQKGPEGLAMMTSVTGLGALVAGTLFVLRGGVRGLTLVALVAGLAIAAGGLLMAATGIFAIGLVGAAFSAAAQVIHGIAVQTLAQTASDRAMRGRVMSIWGLIVRACPAVGALSLGALAEAIGLRPAVALFTALCLPAFAWGMRRRRRVAAALERGLGPKRT
ncbi:MFS transporter [Elioraea sp.]|uniref:MFS transporter n=1 Tax=Elioraea sp. TaxID=2185103 RepID=UPI0025BBD83E|nr:MFS transporter [Elioraea sp.]